MPADTFGTVHKFFKIALGDDADQIPPGCRLSGLAGADGRAKSLSKVEQIAIAKKADSARWDKGKGVK